MKYKVDLLIKARQLKRLSKTQVAAGIGMSYAMVAKVESGERASEKTIFKMSEFLGVPMKKLMAEDSSDAA